MFRIPNVNTPTFAGQAVPDSTDTQAEIMADGGTFAVTGLTATAAGGREVTIAAGSYQIAHVAYELAEPATADFSVGSTTGDRRDIVVGTKTGTVEVVQGEPCTTVGWVASSIGLPPVKPAIPDTTCILWEEYVPGNATTLTSENLTDKRVVEVPPLLASQKGAHTGVAELDDAGHLAAAQFPALSGVVATTAGSLTTGFPTPGGGRLALHVPALSAVATVANMNVSSLSGTATFNDYTLQGGDIVALLGQTTPKQNGPWQVPTSGTGAWTRPADFASGATAVGGRSFIVKPGAYMGIEFVLQTPAGGITIGTSNQSWVSAFGPAPSANSALDLPNLQAYCTPIWAVGGTPKLGLPGTFMLNGQFTWKGSIIVTKGVTFKATSSGWTTTKSVVSSPVGTKLTRVVWRVDATFTGNGVAKHAFYPTYSTHLLLDGEQTFGNAVQTTVVLGRPSTPTTPTASHGFRNEGSMQFVGSTSTSNGYVSLKDNTTDAVINAPNGIPRQGGLWTTSTKSGDTKTHGAHFSGAPGLIGLKIQGYPQSLYDCVTTCRTAPHLGATGSSSSSTITDSLIRTLHSGVRVAAFSTWTITVTGATGGTITLTWNGHTTATMAYNASATTVLTKLKALPTFPSEATASGGALNTDPVVIRTGVGCPILFQAFPTGGTATSVGSTSVIPATAYVGTVTSSTSFTLVNKNGTAIEPTGTVAGITLVGTGLLAQSNRGITVYGHTAQHGKHGGLGDAINIGSSVLTGSVNFYGANVTGSATTTFTNTIVGKTTAARWAGMYQKNVKNTVPVTSLGPVQATTLAVSGAGGLSNFYGQRTTTGHPTSGTYPAGSWVIDSSGVIWWTKTGGTPGTWTQLSNPTATPSVYFDGYNPTGTSPISTTSTSNVMAGLAKLSSVKTAATTKKGFAGFAFTPTKTGNVRIAITLTVTNTAAKGVTAIGYYGTGTAPSKGAAALDTGGHTFTVQSAVTTTAAANASDTIVLEHIATGQTLGTKLWIDAAFSTSTAADTATIKSAVVQVDEVTVASQ